MKAASIFGHVVELLEEFRTSEAIPGDLLFRRFCRQRKYLGSRDRREIGAIYYGFIRRAPSVARELTGDDRIAELDLPRAVLLSSLADVSTSGERIMDAALSLDVDLARLEARVPAVRSAPSLPLALVDEVKAGRSIDESSQLVDRLHEPLPIGVRVDTEVVSVDEAARHLEEKTGQPFRLSCWNGTVLLTDQRFRADSIQGFDDGRLVVQSEASTLVPTMFGPVRGARIFDACAGAGGKSLHLASLVGPEGCIVADDISTDRLDRLRNRLEGSRLQGRVRFCRWTDLEDVDRPTLVLLDVPCTGTGTIPRSPWVGLRFRPEELTSYVAVQRELLDRYAEALPPGGRILYATCSILAKENEQQVDRFLENRRSWRLVPAKESGLSQGLTTKRGELKTEPHRHSMDGFFAALLERIE